MYNHVLDQFYVITKVPISLYEKDNKLINHKGKYCKLDLLDSLKVDGFEKYPIKINMDEDNYFIITRENKSYFILGPLTNNKEIEDFPYKPEALSGYIVRLLKELCEDCVEDEEDPYSFHINRALEYIDEHYNQNVNLEDTSEHLELNKCYFCSLLKEETGLTFTQYLNQKRVEEAKKLLKSTELAIRDVAKKTGFNSQSYFNVVFRKETGLTPLRYRYKNT